MSRPSPILPPARRRQMKECARARFGFDVGKQARQTLIRRVWKGDVKYARRLTASRTVIVLDYDGGEMAFLYSSAAKDIISFLGPDAPETADWRRSQSAMPPLLRPPHFRRDEVRR
jgi:hypothetical protein